MTDNLRITKMRRTSNGVEISVFGEDASLLISNATVERGSLREGVAVTPAQMTRLRTEDDLLRCDRAAARLLAMRDYSEGDLRTKLLTRGFSQKAVKTALDKYRDLGALDDARYAQNLGQNLLEQRPCGKAYLTAHLQKRKIERRLAEQTADGLMAGRNTAAMAVAALEKRWSRFAHLDVEKARTRAYNYLARRGFGYDESRRAFESVWDRNQKVEKD